MSPCKWHEPSCNRQMVALNYDIFLSCSVCVCTICTIFLSLPPDSPSSAFLAPLSFPGTTARAASSATRGASVTQAQRTSLLMMSTARWRRAKAGETPFSSLSGVGIGEAATVATVATARAAGPHESSQTFVGT